MKNKDSLKAAMDRRLSFLDDVPSCRAKVQYRIAQEEEPVVKKKISTAFVLAAVLALISAAALAATLLLSPKVTAVQTADRALEKERGISAEMQTFFGRAEEELADGAVRVTYSGAGNLRYVLGTYTVLVKDGQAEVTWSHDGEDTAGGYAAEAWGTEQLRQMMADSLKPENERTYHRKAEEIAAKYNALEDDSASEAIENYGEIIEARKTAALAARKLSEDEMLAVGREFIVSRYGLSEEQAARLELFTQTGDAEDNGWYDMKDGRPCFMVEYLLSQPEVPEQAGITVTPLPRGEMDGYYLVFVNVETGAVEYYEYNSGLGGRG